MKSATQIFEELPDGSAFVDGSVLDSHQPLVNAYLTKGDLVKLLEAYNDDDIIVYI